ncbi:MAG TPA: ABC transporter permease subunit [Anaerolineaceae bacterium]|nr:ABC transporter permease subunit [Anaerolineaceae bacterium]HPN50233.1 ABC transporter permease subunit [Anaerolineaceae bacterium]
MKPFSSINRVLSRLPENLAIIFMCVVWIIPTLGLLVTSFRTSEAVRTSGWWTALSPKQAASSAEYTTYCASCHGSDGKGVASVDLSNPAVLDKYPRTNRLLAMLRQPVNGEAHVKNPPLPEKAADALAIMTPIQEHLQTLGSGSQESVWSGLTLRNYADAVVGYKGTQDYLTDCEQKNPSALAKFKCDLTDVFNPEGMGSALINTLFVAIPSTFFPILIAAFAAYAFSWMDFKGRQWLFALLVGLQIIPLQMTLVPIARMYASLGMQGTFVGIWLFHTGFGLPYAIYLMRNFLGSLPREIFESAYLDGANHFSAFTRLALPLSIPAIGSLAIFQFLWIWNDFLIAKIFLSNNPVLTVQITNLIDPRGGNWHIMTGAAFLSFIVPMTVFFLFQKSFVRGLLAGSVKG